MGQDMGRIRPAKSGLTRQSFTRVVSHKGMNVGILFCMMCTHVMDMGIRRSGGGGGLGIVSAVV